MVSLPPLLLEGSNGAIAFALLIVTCLQTAYLVATVLRISRNADRSGWRDTWRSTYLMLKPVFALTVASAGLFVRSGPIWWQRLAIHHDLAAIPNFWFQVTLHVVGTMMAVVGLLCWVRVTIPAFFGTRVWALAVVLTCMAFGSPWLADGAIAAVAWTVDAADRLRVF